LSTLSSLGSHASRSIQEKIKVPQGLQWAGHYKPCLRCKQSSSSTQYLKVSRDVTKLKILPAGSFYTEPANVPHYIEIKEDVVLQVRGMGPSQRRFANPSAK